MDTPLTAFVVDIGSLSVRCGYSGDDAPRQLHASCVGVYSPSFSSASSLNDTSSTAAAVCSSSSSSFFSSSPPPPLPDEETGVLLFPLTFSTKRRHVAVQPCLYPTFASGVSSSSSSSSWGGKTSQPSYILHEEVFETLLSCCIEGPLARSVDGLSCCNGAVASSSSSTAAADDEEEDDDDDVAAAACPLHSVSRRGNSSSSSSSSPGSLRGGAAAAAAPEAGVAGGDSCCRCRKRGRKKAGGGKSFREWRPTEMCGLGESLCDFPLLLSEPNLHCRDLREKMVEIAFEKLSSPAVYVAPRAQLSCLSLGRSSGMIVDIGAAATSIAPVVDGFVLHQEVGEWPAGGNLLDQLLACALRRHRLPLLPLFAAHKKYALAGSGGVGGGQQQLQQLRHHHHYTHGAPGATATALGTTAAAAGGGTRASSGGLSSSSGSNSFLDWSGVHPTYLQRSQCAALRALKEGFFRVSPGTGAAAAAKEETSPRAAAGGGRGETADAETAGGVGALLQQQQPHSISPLVFPPPAAAAAAPHKLQQKDVSLHPIASRYITVLPPPPLPQQRSAHHNAARDRSSSSSASTAAALAANSGTLELPDGTLLAAEELSTAIPEVLFRPQEMLQQLQQEESWLQGAAVRSFKGIGLALREVAARVESLEARREVLNGIVLTGGCSAMPGLYERLNAELQNDPSLTHGLRWRLLAAPGAFERKYSSWLGGSILSSMGAFQSMWCSREEYAEHGPSIVERKCY